MAPALETNKSTSASLRPLDGGSGFRRFLAWMEVPELHALPATVSRARTVAASVSANVLPALVVAVSTGLGVIAGLVVEKLETEKGGQKPSEET